MSTKPIIAIDIDDVLVEMNENVRLWSNKITGATFTKEDFQQPGDYWGYYERIWAEKGYSDVLRHDEFEVETARDAMSIPLLAGASFAISELQKKYKIILITARPPVFQEVTERWVKEHFSQFDVELYFAKNPHHERPEAAKTKGELCKELGAFLLIDDNPGHCQSALDAGVETILFGQYGWHNVELDGAIRCKDWPTVLEYISGRQ